MERDVSERLYDLEQKVEELRTIVLDSSDPTGERRPGGEMEILAQLRDLLQDARVMLDEEHVEEDEALLLWGMATRQGVTNQLSSRSALLTEDRRSMARTAGALSSELRLAIMARLIDGEASSRELGESAELGGGPLYHHLRELMAAGLIRQPDRNRYRITGRGLDAFLSLASVCRRHREVSSP